MAIPKEGYFKLQNGRYQQWQTTDKSGPTITSNRAKNSLQT